MVKKTVHKIIGGRRLQLSNLDKVFYPEVGFTKAQVIEYFPKTSGSKGLQLYAPLNTPTNYHETKAFAHAVAERLEREHPQQVVSKMQKHLRVGKVFVDWSQNDAYKTTVCVYSLRAKNRPTDSTPLTWNEVATALRKRP